MHADSLNGSMHDPISGLYRSTYTLMVTHSLRTSALHSVLTPTAYLLDVATKYACINLHHVVTSNAGQQCSLLRQTSCHTLNDEPNH